ncbi:MAG TPA: PAS domain-containing protein [Nevskiaceae bacterium]|nr:PAS domain-containing protein [Nevskiaceae bacterium]
MSSAEPTPPLSATAIPDEVAAVLAGDRFRHLAESIPQLIWITDAQLVVRYLNPQFIEYLGETPQTLAVRGWDHLVHPDDLEPHRQRMLNSLATGEPMVSEMRLRRVTDGSWRWMLNRATPIRDAQGRLQSLYGACTDIQDLKDTQAELQRARLAIEAADLGTWTWLPQQDRFEADAAVERLLGRTAGEFDRTLQGFLACVHPEDVEGLRAVIEGALRAPTAFSHDYRTVTTQGRQRWIRGSGRSLFQHGQLEQIAGVIRDVTLEIEVQQALESNARELERANAELDDFTYVASHDLKEPLRGMGSYARFLLEDYAERLDDTGREMLVALGQQAERMQRLIEDLLQIARLGREPLRRLPAVALDQVLDEVLASLDHLLRERQVQLQREPLGQLDCDPVRVGELLRNLITNGIKYNQATPPVLAFGRQRLAGGEDAFFVRDNGIGIRAEDRERVFAPFKRLHARDRYGGGSGVGLTIVKKIVEAHHGSIWLESQPGRGSTFYFTL